MTPKDKIKSQIATIIVFIIAVIFLFTLIGINISQLAQKKTAIDNAADTVGLQLASQLGSMANALKHDLKIYNKESENCDLNWRLIAGPLLMAGGVAVVWTGLGTLPGLGMIGLGALWTFQGGSAQYAAHKQAAIENANIKLKNLSSYQRVVEMPVAAALFNLNEDTGMVEDTFDMDRDGQTNDEILRFAKWYNLRLDEFNNSMGLGTYITNFYYDGLNGIEPFFGYNNDRFDIDYDTETLMVKTKEKMESEGKKEKDAVRWQVDLDGDGTMDIKLVEWFRDQLPGMLKEMRRYGYGINAKRGGDDKIAIDDSGYYEYENKYGGISPIDTWINDIEEFEDTIVKTFYNMDSEARIGGLETWLGLLKNDKNEDWYKRLGEMKIRAEELRDTLEERAFGTKNGVVQDLKYEPIHQCVSACTANESACCGNGSGAECNWQTVCGPEYCAEYEKDDPETEEEENECIRWDQDCWDEAISWEGCCGPVRGCGQLCNSPCKPTSTCSTPLDGNRKCCEVAVLESPAECSNVPPVNIVDRYNSIVILDSFIADITSLQNLINEFNTKVQGLNKQSYDKMHEAFYIWTDKVGGVSDPSGGQLAGHIVYAKIEGLDPAAGFKLPYIFIRQKMWQAIPMFPFFAPLPQTCVGVKVGAGAGEKTGNFTLTVARWDEDTSKQGPLSRFWRFSFGKPGVSVSDELFVRDQAALFADYIKKGQYEYLGGLTSEEKNRLIGILRNGIVSKVSVNYGPGYTYDPDSKEFPGEAKKRNEDIFIRGTSSDFDYQFK